MKKILSHLNSQHKLAVLAILLALLAGVAINLASFYGAPITGYAAGFVYINVSCTTSITLVNGTLNFVAMASGTTNDTIDTFPPPFYIRNDGNVEVNVTIRATSLFEQNPNPTTMFQFQCGNTSQFNCSCGPGLSPTNCTGAAQTNGSQLLWDRIPLNTSTAALAIWNLSALDDRDEAEIDINVTVAINESAGGKDSVVSIEAVANKEAGYCV